MKYFGGIEGGETNSTCIICDEKGECIVTKEGLGTNHSLIGMIALVARIAELVQRSKESANISEDETLDALGLSLSGLWQKHKREELEKFLSSSYPNLAKSYLIMEDAMGSIYTASPNGGVVLTSDISSSALLINPDGSTQTCGGWGIFIGDEGSAIYIALRAIKIIFNEMDGFRRTCPYPIEGVWDLIKEYFKIETREELMTNFFQNFDKSLIAPLSTKLAEAAEKGNRLAQSLFREAGEDLGTMTAALIPKIQPDSLKSNTLNILCMGSVWSNLSLLKEGFRKGLQNATIPFAINLLRLNKSSAFGACYLAADHIEFDLPRNYSDNYDIWYQYQIKCACNPRNRNY
uniref:N-acetyl-D-glucosamine kinase n=1 Tax=Glossina brevipalpis TaxID=37001 RepID=A0A1A9X2K6_9MUSC